MFQFSTSLPSEEEQEAAEKKYREEEERKDEVIQRVIDVLAEEKCTVSEAETILYSSISRIKNSSTVQKG